MGLLRRWTVVVCLALPSAFLSGCRSADETPPGGDGGTDEPDGGGLVCVDEDEDGFGSDCAAGPDCDDADPAVNPDAIETCDGVDQDCDELRDEELDAPS